MNTAAHALTDDLAALKWRDLIMTGVIPGAVAGLSGGLVFGLAIVELGDISSIASLVRAESAWVGFVIHMLIAATIGMGLGILVWHNHPGVGQTLYWGMVCGSMWWFLGTLTLHPLFLGNELAWTAEHAQAAFPALLGHLLYGATAGIVLAILRLLEHSIPSTGTSIGTMIRGALAGTAGMAMIALPLSAQGYLEQMVGASSGDTVSMLWVYVLGIGLLSGAGLSLIYASPALSSGAGIIRGCMFGFLLWILLPLTVLPLLKTGDLLWQIEEARAHFPTLVAFLLFGGATALIYRWLTEAYTALFNDMSTSREFEGIGTQGLRAMGRGIVGGIVGGAIFAGVMIQTGALTSVSGLVGANNVFTGMVVHMGIAVMVGSSYGLLFRGQSYDLGSAIGWGASYGFIWWVVGSLTLFPILLGTVPDWRPDAVAALFPFLVGHLMFGAGLGAMLHAMEAGHNPWWITRRQAATERVERRRQQALTSAPALWTLVVVMALTLSVLLGSDGSSIDLPRSVY
jgi:uncharacterized membrane protein YagU involved in acid resistance